MIPAERKALLFLAAFALLGVGVRVAGGRDAPPLAGGGPGALDAQLAAVERAMAPSPDAPRDGARETGRRPRGRERDDAGRPQRVGGRDLGRAGASSRGGSPGGPVDVDVADAAALEALPGIGPALARRIVDDRAARGAFGSLEALGEVRGVGPRLLARLAPLVVFSGPARPPPPHAAPPARRRRGSS